MPTYTVSTVGISLSQDQKNAIAELITAAHYASTGAPGFFAQVFFTEHTSNNHFFGGKQNTNPHIFVQGLIRAGRTIEAKKDLMAHVAKATAEISLIGAEDVWMYVQDIDAKQMIEYGRVLPEPGMEDEWRRGVSKEKAASLARDGVLL